MGVCLAAKKGVGAAHRAARIVVVIDDSDVLRHGLGLRRRLDVGGIRLIISNRSGRGIDDWPVAITITVPSIVISVAIGFMSQRTQQKTCARSNGGSFAGVMTGTMAYGGAESCAQGSSS